MNIRESCDMLGVSSSASDQEVKQAYRDLVSVWHPDRFTHNPRLKQKAEEQLKRINRAYQVIREARKSGIRQGPSPPPKPDAKPDSQPEEPDFTASVFETFPSRSTIAEKLQRLIGNRPLMILTACVGIPPLILCFALIGMLVADDPASPRRPPSRTTPVLIIEEEPDEETDDAFLSDDHDPWIADLKQRMAWEKEWMRKTASGRKGEEAAGNLSGSGGVSLREVGLRPAEAQKEDGEIHAPPRETEKTGAPVQNNKAAEKQKALFSKFLLSDSKPYPENHEYRPPRETGRNRKNTLNTEPGPFLRDPRILEKRESLQKRMADADSAFQNRFARPSHGVVQDMRTGLMWAFFDSYLDRNRLMDFESARHYAEELRIGGYADWRLPTASELAEIYYGTPSYPSIHPSSSWYWTSDAYIAGWHRVARIFKPSAGNSLREEYAGIHKKGMAHPVRP